VIGAWDWVVLLGRAFLVGPLRFGPLWERIRLVRYS